MPNGSIRKLSAHGTVAPNWPEVDNVPTYASMTSVDMAHCPIVGTPATNILPMLCLDSPRRASRKCFGVECELASALRHTVHNDLSPTVW